VMLPPAVAVICGTLGGLYFGELLAGDFWKPLEPEYFVPGLAAGAGQTARVQWVFWALLCMTVLLLVLFFVSLWVFRRRPGHMHKRLKRNASKYISQSQLRYRYGRVLYYAGLVVLFCCALWNGLLQYVNIGSAESRVPAGERNILCLRVSDFPVPVLTAAGRHYERMECRLVMYSADGRKQIQGSENMLVYIALDSTMGNRYGKENTATLSTGLLPGDVLMTRCRAFSFVSETPVAPTSSGALAVSSFDYPRYMARRGFYCRAYVYDYQRIPTNLTLYERLRRLRVPLISRWEGEAGAVLSGICLGDKSGLGKQVREKYNVAGASHILAVSGLHVGALYGCLVFVLGLPQKIRQARRYRSRHLVKIDQGQEFMQTGPGQSQILKTYSLSGGAGAHIIALLLIWAYAAVVGFSASVMRAALMLSVYGAGKVLGSRTNSLNVLSVTALILVVFKPMNLYDLGFQLSFTAVLSLILFFPLLRNLLSLRHFVLRYLWELFCCSLSVQLGTLWLTSGTFGVIPLYSLLCNFFVVPFSAVILYFFLLYLVVMGLHLENALTLVTRLLLILATILDKAVMFFAGLPYTPIRYQPHVTEQLLMLWCTGYLYFFLRDRENRRP
jgi:ComEC/Rec2-related protein